MKSKEIQPQLLPIVLGIGCFGLLGEVVTGLFALWLIRFFVGPNLVAWWRDTFGDPILRVIAHIVIATKGDTGATILLSALALFGILWILRTASTAVARRSFESMRAAQSLSQDVDTARDQLRSIFSDDPEQIALYQSRVANPASSRNGRVRRPGAAALGCLPSMLFSFFLSPISIFLGLALFDSLQRLTGMFQASRSLEQSTGQLFAGLAPFVPLDKSAFGFNLTDRSAWLTIAVAAVAIVTWLMSTMPRVSVMWPRGISRSSLGFFLVGVLIIYAVTNGLILLVIVMMAAFNLAMMILVNRIGLPLRLRVAGLWNRARG
jgi:hypothetical protein